VLDAPFDAPALEIGHRPKLHDEGAGVMEIGHGKRREDPATRRALRRCETSCVLHYGPQTPAGGGLTLKMGRVSLSIDFRNCTRNPRITGEVRKSVPSA
jgi:hypothetical protein